MILLTILVLATTKLTLGDNNLNDSAYARLPALFALDSFSRCLLAPGDTYCYVDASLVANETSQLLTVLQEYSSYRKTHFNHTLVHRGLCVTKTCWQYLGNNTNLVDVTEACLNATLYKSHGLQTRVIKDKVFCTEYGEKPIPDTADYAVMVLVVVLFALNIAGSFYYFVNAKGDSIGSRLLICFSVQRNWSRLFSTEHSDPRLNRLKSFTGLKVIMTFIVILGHSPLSCVMATNNPEYMENVYSNIYYSVALNGPLFVQTFLYSAGFWLAYNVLLNEEKRRISWKMLPQGIALAWLRLTPMYAILLAYVSTWQRHVSSGPIWKPLIEYETLQCRQYWYYNLLYVNNYVDNIDCMPHAWYMGAHMQLAILGMVIFFVATSSTARKFWIAVTFVVGLLAPAIHTMVQHLDPIVLLSPESAHNKFLEDPTFNQVYKRTHTNLVCFAIGMALGMVVYDLQKQNFNMDKYKKFRVLYWVTAPLGILVVMSGAIFYIEAIQIPLWVSAVYASGVKLIFGLLMTAFIVGTVFKIEDTCREILEWNGWAPLGRLAYGAYLVHVIIIRNTVGQSTTLVDNSFWQIFMTFLSVLSASFLITAPLWILVAAPCDNIVRVLFNPSSENKTETRQLGSTQDFKEIESKL